MRLFFIKKGPNLICFAGKPQIRTFIFIKTPVVIYQTSLIRQLLFMQKNISTRNNLSH